MNVAVPVEVPPRGTVPAEVTVTAADANGAAMVATRVASRVAVKPIAAPFLRMFKGFDPPEGLVDL